ncbi:hypothetical protein [Brevundimonas sp.]|uniref:hypothetical protein n=1 Tax=Brevundimonas sp. TaxID=1871086 RepID=UPI002899F2F5|nr:hypothetical protein [Brevundimonas sp.]
MRIVDLFWPMLEPPTDDEQRKATEGRKHDLDVIQTAAVSKDLDVLIEEARRLSDLENERRKTAETKAAIYLTFVGVLAPILATIAPDALSPDKGWPRLAITLALFLAAGAYLLWCGVWALRAIEVQTSSHPDAAELATMWTGADRKVALARELLKCVRLNRPGVNRKVTAIKMAHMFATRAFAMFVLGLLVRSGWTPVSQLLAAIGRVLT